MSVYFSVLGKKQNDNRISIQSSKKVIEKVTNSSVCYLHLDRVAPFCERERQEAFRSCSFSFICISIVVLVCRYCNLECVSGTETPSAQNHLINHHSLDPLEAKTKPKPNKLNKRRGLSVYPPI